LRFISRDPKRDSPHFRCYPTLSGPILEPTLGDRKLLYLGINWERSARAAWTSRTAPRLAGSKR
jgi:hypothetical protein